MRRKKFIIMPKFVNVRLVWLSLIRIFIKLTDFFESLYEHHIIGGHNIFIFCNIYHQKYRYYCIKIIFLVFYILQQKLFKLKWVSCDPLDVVAVGSYCTNDGILTWNIPQQGADALLALHDVLCSSEQRL
jgi:hypothetical protein